jgi:hypothetical protein
MTVSDLKSYIDVELNKHASGNSLSPKEYNLFLKAEIFSFVRSAIMKYRQFVSTGAPLDDTMFTAMLIDSLQKETTETLTAGAFTLPTDFMFMSDLYGTSNVSQKKIELISVEEYSRRTHNLLSKPIAYYPVAYIVGTSCKVYPANMTALVINYISTPTIPIFDYYSDANYQIVPLAAAATHTLTAGEYGSLGQTSGTTVTSLTVEMDLPQELQLAFADHLLSKVLIRDRDTNTYSASENEIQKES